MAERIDSLVPLALNLTALIIIGPMTIIHRLAKTDNMQRLAVDNYGCQRALSRMRGHFYV